MNNHLFAKSDQYSIGFIDSGTTFTYLPRQLFNDLKMHFDWFCSLPNEKHCIGSRQFKENDRMICFNYDEKKFPEGPK